MRLAGFATLLAAAATASAAPGSAAATGTSVQEPLQLAAQMADSEMARRGDSLDFGSGPKATWSYTTGFFAYALLQLGKDSGDPRYSAYAAQAIGSFIAPDGTIRTYDPTEYNLDLITPGRAVLELYAKTRDPKFKKAADILRLQLATQPRNSDGGFWHKLIYPEQMWLDGLYMAGPFYAHYSALYGKPADSEDAAAQIIVAAEHTYDRKTGLFYHAWDAAHTQSWADPQTGRSPSFWGRSIGWLAMAAADELDDLKPGEPGTRSVGAVFGRVAGAIVRWQDPASGVWWQVVDQGPRLGNYLESSASSMFVYALAKGVNRGWLPRDTCEPDVLRGYRGLVAQFVRRDGTGVSLTHCCSVAGLNNKNSAGRARDGSFGYYVSEPVVDNDLKGVSAFMLASLEVQRMLGPGRSIP